MPKTVEEKIINLADLARFYMGLNRKSSDEYGRQMKKQKIGIIPST